MKKKKGPQKDFEASMLPSNRLGQFYDILKHRFFLIMGLGALCLLFFAPYLTCLILRDTFFLTIGSGMGEESEKAQAIATISFTYSLLRIPCLLVFSLGLGGAFKVFRELLYDEPIFLKDDFLSGIKENARSFLIFSLFAGLFSFCADLLSSLFSSLWLQAIFPGINFAFVYPVLFVCFFLSATYSNSAFKTASVSLTLYFKAFPSVFLTYLALSGLLFLDYIDLLLIKYLVIVVVFLAYVPYALLLGYANQMRLYDPLINKDQFPTYYQKGLSGGYDSEGHRLKK